MLARRNRVTSGDDYRMVVRRGQRFRGAVVLTSVWASGQSRPPRFGFIISKQVGSAVIRNTIRRRLKAVCAEHVGRVHEGTDVVIRAFPASADATFAQLRDDVTRSLARAHALRETVS